MRWVASAAFLCLSACASGHFEERGPRSRELRTNEMPVAGLRPRLTMQPAGIIGVEAQRYQVVAHPTVRRGGRLVVRRGSEMVEIDYRIGSALRFPVRPGEFVYLSTPAQGDGLMMRDESERLLALLSVNGGFLDLFNFQVLARMEGVLPIYTEVRAEANGCLTSLEHYPLSLVRDEEVRHILPGLSDSVSLREENQRWDLVGGSEGAQVFTLHAISASAPASRRGGLAERCPTRAHTSFFLTRLESER